MNRGLRFIGLSIVLLTSCSPQPLYIEDIQYIQALGLDYEDGEIQATSTTTIFMPAEESLPETETHTASAENLEELYDHLQSESSRAVDTSRLRVFLFGEEVATEEGAFNFLDIVQRNPMVEQDMQVALVKGSAREILEEDYPPNQTVYSYLLDLIEHNEEGNIPPSTLHDFMYQYYADGADPYLTMMERDEGDVLIPGMALFQEGTYIDHLDLDDTQIFRKLVTDTEDSTVNIDLNEDKRVAFHRVSSRPNWEIQQEDDEIDVSVEMEVEGSLREARNIDISKPENIEQLEGKAGQYFEHQMDDVIQFLQEKEIDPIGISERVGQNIRGLDIKKWKEDEYPDVDVDVNVDFTIEDTGAVE